MVLPEARASTMMGLGPCSDGTYNLSTKTKQTGGGGPEQIVCSDGSDTTPQRARRFSCFPQADDGCPFAVTDFVSASTFRDPFEWGACINCTVGDLPWCVLNCTCTTHDIQWIVSCYQLGLGPIDDINEINLTYSYNNNGDDGKIVSVNGRGTGSAQSCEAPLPPTIAVPDGCPHPNGTFQATCTDCFVTSGCLLSCQCLDGGGSSSTACYDLTSGRCSESSSVNLKTVDGQLACAFGGSSVPSAWRWCPSECHPACSDKSECAKSGSECKSCCYSSAFASSCIDVHASGEICTNSSEGTVKYNWYVRFAFCVAATFAVANCLCTWQLMLIAHLSTLPATRATQRQTSVAANIDHTHVHFASYACQTQADSTVSILVAIAVGTTLIVGVAAYFCIVYRSRLRGFLFAADEHSVTSEPHVAVNDPGPRGAPELERDIKWPHDGANMHLSSPTSLKCTSCGSSRVVGSRFCNNCGAKL
jgi:hypothetical protein